MLTDWITSISAFGSLIILAFYTYYTYKMQKSIANQVKEQTRQTEELIHQRQLSVLPYLILEIDENVVFIKNIGNGTAFNIEIKSTENNQNINLNDEKLKFKFETVSMLLPNETKGILGKNISAYKNNIVQTEIWELNNNDLIVGEIIFRNIEGHFYKENLQSISKSSVRFSFPVLIKNH